MTDNGNNDELNMAACKDRDVKSWRKYVENNLKLYIYVFLKITDNALKVSN